MRIKDLEVAANVAEEVGACGLGKASADRVFGAIEGLALVRDSDQTLRENKSVPFRRLREPVPQPGRNYNNGKR